MNIKVLNLYAGIGGNRKLWENVEVTAVEKEPSIAKVYQENYPEDKVIVTDAHNYLLNNYFEFDFIWSSPPCPTHSRIRFAASKRGDYPVVFPDLKLYEEIIFLMHYAECFWVVENVRGYYEPLIKPYILGRHYLWSNFIIPYKSFSEEGRVSNKISTCSEVYSFNLNGKDIAYRKDQVIRNLVNPKLALYVFRCAFKEKQLTL